MCVEAMDTATSKRVRSGFLRKTAAWKLQWRLVRASAEEEDDEARRESRAAIRKPLRRHHQRRTQLLKLSRALSDVSREEPKPVEECRPLPFLHGHHHHHHHPGAMAPENTTQYLMSNAYGDMGEQDGGGAAAASQARAHAHCESLSPRSVYAALDCDYDSCLAFQQRDFEEEFGDLWDQ